MTPTQFDACATLLRMRGGPPQECARLVLVEGFTIKEASEAAGLSYRQGAAAVQRVRECQELARKAAGGMKG